MEGLIAQETGIEAVPTTAMPDSEEERRLADEIVELWAVHAKANGVVNKTRTELKAIRERLSGRLYEMKQLLARRGCGGQWSAWLKERKLSRATADRLVQRFAATLPGHESSHESIEDVEKLAKTVWQRVQKLLTSDEAVIAFITHIADLAGIACEGRQEGLLIFAAAEQAADELPGSASPIESAPELTGEVSATTDEPCEESVATLPATGQAAAAAEAASGAAA